jgi:prolyl 4-hydroxylase
LSEDGTSVPDTRRTSRTAFLPRTNPVTRCIIDRVVELQGFIDPIRVEDLQITAYNKGQEYQAHYDWWADSYLPDQRYENRISTIFVVLDAECENCGTRFPNLQANWTEKDKRWCNFMECDDSTVTVKAVPGAGFFWKNLYADGRGDERTFHAGLPVQEGHKTGMNIWTRIPVSRGAADSDMTGDHHYEAPIAGAPADGGGQPEARDWAE